MEVAAAVAPFHAPGRRCLRQPRDSFTARLRSSSGTTTVALVGGPKASAPIARVLARTT